MTEKPDLNRILAKLDEHLGKNDYSSAERHLIFWMNEAKACDDKRCMFSLANEQMGLYRKLGREKEALEALELANSLIDASGLGGTISAGTCFVNSATVYKAFGMAEKAIPLFERAKEIYEKNLPDNDGRLGGLYNNTALALSDLKRYDEAMINYEKAIGVMKKVTYGELEQAITYLNIADILESRDGRDAAKERIDKALDTALDLLSTEGIPHNGYYAFVCEKCAPSFGYYGRDDAAKALREIAEEIYEGT